MKTGEVLVEAGEILGPAEVAVLISAGFTLIEVLKPPLIGILSTGSELVDFGSPLERPSQVRDSNRLLLQSLLTESHIPVRDYGIITDDRSMLISTFQRISTECDLIITTGGVSMGDKDEVKPVIEEIGKVLFGRVNVKPGKPTTFGLVGNTPVFALPGNPASCFVTYYLFVEQALHSLLRQPYFPSISISLPIEMTLDPERPEYHRATVTYKSGKFLAISTGNQQSSRLMSLAKANCLVKLPKKAVNGPISVSKADGILIRPLIPWKSGMTEESLKPECGHSEGKHREKQHFEGKLPRNLSISVLTVSDRASSGEYTDETGPSIREMLLEKYPHALISHLIVPDSIPSIQSAVQQWTSTGTDLVLTLGGTGMSPKDHTPEAILPLISRFCPGIVHQMLSASLGITPMAVCARPVAGVVDAHTLVITLPGSVKGARENLACLLPCLDHLLSQLHLV